MKNIKIVYLTKIVLMLLVLAMTGSISRADHGNQSDNMVINLRLGERTQVVSYNRVVEVQCGQPGQVEKTVLFQICLCNLPNPLQYDSINNYKRELVVTFSDGTSQRVLLGDFPQSIHNNQDYMTAYESCVVSLKKFKACQ